MRNRYSVHVLILLAVGVIAYANTLFAPFQFDDPINIELNPFVRNPVSYAEYKNYCSNIGQDQPERTVCDYTLRRFVGYLTFAWNYRMGGTDTAGYHAVNLFIHILNALLVYGIVLLTFRTPPLASSRYREDSRAVAFLAAFLFLAHPVQTQAVTYIVQRLTSLTTLFYLLSFMLYIQWRLGKQTTDRQTTDKRTTDKRTTRRSDSPKICQSVFFYLSSLLSAVLAMKTKEIAFTLPVMIALYELMFFSAPAKKRAVFLLPFFLTMLIIPAGVLSAQKTPSGMIGGMSEATRALSSLPRWEYFITELPVIVTYLRLIVFPVRQNLDYDYPVFRTFLNAEVILSFLVITGAAALAVFLYRRSKKGCAGHLRLMTFGIAWFFITLSVESSVFPIADVIFEHRLYLPSAGLFPALGMAAMMLLTTAERRGRVLSISVRAALLLIMLALPYAAFARNSVWKDEFTLWEDVIRKSPNKSRGYTFLSNAYDKRGNTAESIRLLYRALQIDPNNAIANSKMGILYAAKRDYRTALTFYDRAEASDPHLATIPFARANLYAELGQYDKALAGYERTLEENPAHDQAYNNRGNIHLIRKEYAGAVADYGRALAIEPANVEAHINRGMAFFALKEYGRALEDYQQALALQPGNVSALLNRGAVHYARGEYRSAIDDFSQVIAREPFSGGGYLRRGKAYRALGRTAEAASDFKRACESGEKEGCRTSRKPKD